MSEAPVITALGWAPDFAQGLVRDLRVRWAFEETGTPYRVRRLDLPKNREEPHRAIQPFGQIPTYQDGDVTLFESGAIVLYIGERWPGLLPEGKSARARAMQWVIAALSSVEPAASDILACDAFEADKPWAKDRRAPVEQTMHGRLSDLARALGDRDWLDGSFTAGDLIMVSVLRQLRHTDLVAEHANLAASQARGEARPAFVKALADHMAAFDDVPPPGFDQSRSRGE